jgi:predicted MFS family arabinose efflux permease
MIPIWLHLTLMILSEIICFMGMAISSLFVIMYFNLLQSQDSLSGIILSVFGIAIFFGGSFGGVYISRSIFRNLIPAKCEVIGCNGYAYCYCSHPISYECQDCGTDHETGIYEDEP